MYKRKNLIKKNGEEEYFAPPQTYSPYARVYDKLLKKRTIFLGDELDRTLSSNIVATLLSFEDEEPGEPIKFYINSCGGDLVDGLFSIYDTIQMISSPVHTICIGEASSSAAVLLAAGTKGHRAATANSRIMIHQVQTGASEGRGTDIEIEAKETKAVKRQMTEMLARHCGQTYRKVYRDCENDKYLSATEAKAYGIMDIILEPKKMIPDLKTRKRSRKKKAQ